MADFVHLHLHTEYSLLDGLTTISKVVKKAGKMGMPALAITDHGNMYGSVAFYNACSEYNSGECFQSMSHRIIQKRAQRNSKSACMTKNILQEWNTTALLPGIDWWVLLESGLTESISASSLWMGNIIVRV